MTSLQLRVVTALPHLVSCEPSSAWPTGGNVDPFLLHTCPRQPQSPLRAMNESSPTSSCVPVPMTLFPILSLALFHIWRDVQEDSVGEKWGSVIKNMYMFVHFRELIWKTPEHFGIGRIMKLFHFDNCVSKVEDEVQKDCHSNKQNTHHTNYSAVSIYLENTI